MGPAPDERGASELDELLAQAGWMRALARSLVADPLAAEDLVQDAWVVALEKRAAVRIDLAAWLRTVVRNLALRRRRREGERPAIERRTARAREGETRDVVERMELQRWLAGALLALDEPYRSAVLLRHVEDLDPGEIARRQGCSREAARQRVARGLARLRRALDAEHGGREGWSLVLAPLARRARVPLEAPLAAGGLLMGSKTVLGSLAAVAALTLLWLTREHAGETLEREPEPARAGATAALETAADDAPPASAPAREPVRAAASPAAAMEPGPEPADSLFARLSGRVVDPARAPVAGAEVVVRRPLARHFSVLDPADAREAREVGRAVTAADGRFAFELERGIPFDVAVTLRGGALCDQLLPERYAGEELEVVLDAGFVVHGRVTRARDGQPIENARVRVFQLNRASAGERLARTDADGSYRVRFAFHEDATLEVTPEREMGSGWLELVPGLDGSVQKDLALADGIEVTGRVTEKGSGHPIEGALVGEGWTFRRSAATGPDGAYRLPGFGVQGVQELHARAAGHGKAQIANLPPAVDGVMRVDFELPRGRSARGRVVDARGRPVEGAYVAAVASEDGAEGQRTDWISAHTDAAGRFELGGLTPELRHCLFVSREGFATAVFDFPASELDALELELEDVALPPPALLSGRVVDEHGAGVAGVEVVLAGANRDRARLREGSSLPPAGDWYVGTRRTHADDEGRFWFGALPAGDFVLHARKRGQPESARLALSVAEGELREEVVLVHPRGDSIRGEVVDALGQGLGGVYVSVSLVAPREPRPSGGPATSATARTDAAGRFELSGLPPGDYRIDLHPYELAGDPDSPWLSTTLESVASGAEALRVELPRGRSIRGRLIDRSGAALVGHAILATHPTRPESPGTVTKDDGTFLLEVPAGTVWDLEVRGAPQTDAWNQVLERLPGVAAGTRDLLVQL